MKALSFTALFHLFSFVLFASHWQQQVDYKIQVDVDEQLNQMKGNLQLIYTNNSPDTLNKVYFHLYYNAFQPGSMMDVRSRSIADPDRRVKDRIFKLEEHEIGYHRIESLTYNDQSVEYSISGTIMKVELPKAILPSTAANFEIKFKSQIPKQIRRTGRDNKEGIRYSMSQWYPKIAEYDRNGWHPHQYVGREFYSPWGDFDVKITIDSSYTVAAGGILQNPDEIGKGYADTRPDKSRLTYHFLAENVHDFMWAADTAYVHEIVKMKDDLDFHYFYRKDTAYNDYWEKLQKMVKTALPYIEKNFGDYPYPIYNVIQGGDGGMEYPMGTLITGHRKMKSLLGVTVHELMHSWYQMMLATNESYLYWMDEGFTTYATNVTEAFVLNDSTGDNPHKRSYGYYRTLVASGVEEPLTTHADIFNTNKAYSYGAYSKGCVFLNQLKYILGDDVFAKALLSYYDQWRFKHPDDVDFIRVLEQESDLELNWYLDYWVKTTKHIDYALYAVYEQDKKTRVRLQKEGEMPMPLDIKVELKNGEVKWYHIPTGLTLGHKPLDYNWTLLTDWPWVNDYYSFSIPNKLKDIKTIEIDPERNMADVTLKNNSYPLSSEEVEVFGEIENDFH
ncbi:M1 family metallopeptidase [Reichenbachiella versicolor]|uniref:M1 family metallopeptidase n=1 Tax=Reichenbachiella versicolor TaxID=1821036 RepID=UPI000D6E0F31|nr:M1 family metallopeptidase [Reichenbachiella versicolor]